LILITTLIIVLALNNMPLEINSRIRPKGSPFKKLLI